MRVAAVDIGTNSVLLLIAETRPGSLAPLLERATITRLGEGVDRTHELGAEARARTLACLTDYARDLGELAPDAIAAVGTSALRDARGGPDFAREAERVLGVLPLVIDGRREAELTFAGALSGLELRSPVAVFDVGGGSTEIVVGTVKLERGCAEVALATSLDIGSVRLFERHVRADPPSFAELERVRKDVDLALAAAPEVPKDATLVGVAGTVTTLCAIALGVEPYDAARVHGSRLARDTVRELAERLASLSLAERTELPGLDPRRADVIVAGAVIVERVLAHYQKDELVVSDRGVRWGLAEELTRA